MAVGCTWLVVSGFVKSNLRLITISHGQRTTNHRLSKTLLHENEMIWHKCRRFLRDLLLYTGKGIANLLVQGRQFGAMIKNIDLHYAAACGAAKVFRVFDQF